MKINEELEQLLKNLKLRRILDIYEEQLGAAEKEDVSYSEFLTRLMRAQWHARQEHALEWRIRNAKLPERCSLDTFPYARQPGVNRKQIRTFAELDFVRKKKISSSLAHWCRQIRFGIGNPSESHRRTCTFLIRHGT